MKKFSRRVNPVFWIAVSLFSMLLSSCAKSYVHPDYFAPDFSIRDLKGVKTWLIVSDQIDVRQFAKAFNGAYGNADSFSTYLARTLADSLNHGDPVFSVTMDRADSSSARYSLRIQNIVIDSSMKYVAAVATPSGMSGQSNGTGNIENTGGGFEVRCLVSYDFEIWDPDGTTKKASFKVMGASTVFLSNETALENAVWDGMMHLTGYLRAGQAKTP